MSELIVHEIPAAWGLPSVGPFCLKLEAWLKIADIPFTAVIDATPFKGPKGKLPWIEHEGRRIGDSGFIIDYLTTRFERDPDAALTAAERATAHALRRLLEENLYWTLVYDRWMVDDNWPTTRAIVLGLIPAPLRALIAPIARRGVRKQLEGHGIGKHARAEIRAIGIRDVSAVADFLGDKQFLMGAAATGIDAVAYGVLANIMCVPVSSPVKDAAAGHANLVEYIERMRKHYFVTQTKG